MLEVNTIQGIAGAQKPTDASRGTRTSERAAETKNVDSVVVSDKAEQAAEVRRIVELSAQDSEVRQERVEQARTNLEEGIQDINDVLTIVASRLSPLV